MTWSSSNNDIAIVDQTGLVTGISEGYVFITVTCDNVDSTCGFMVIEDAGVENLMADPDSMISIYTTDGILIKKDCKVEDIKTLNKGIYIIVSGKDRYKISI